jgi:antitoxin (DNA-binding transcriptional repressor) of toxin-antitoxin stability system
MPYNATDLRREIYRILDRILETGEPVDVERNGRLLRIIPVERPPLLTRLRPIPDLIAGDPASLEHLDWSHEWKP